MPWVNEDMCVGCGVCVDDCPVGAITLKEDQKAIYFITGRLSFMQPKIHSFKHHCHTRYILRMTRLRQTWSMKFIY